jgi:Glycosyl hydrolases family 43
MHPPLIDHLYTADPSVRLFAGRVYLYASHDTDQRHPENVDGDHFAMQDYHVFSCPDMATPMRDHGPALRLDQVPWASRQLWAPDAAERDGRYYFYFPARDREGVFRIGVATGADPAGPFTPEPLPIPGAYSIDPCVFRDDDGEHYLSCGGIWGGGLQCWRGGSYDRNRTMPADDEPADCPRVARLAEDMRHLAEPLRELLITDAEGRPLRSGDHERRFFEASWMHRHRGVYYFSYSTGDTHRIAYATGASPYGPFTFRGYVLEPVLGWTTAGSIVEVAGRWWLFYHDSSLSGGVTAQRCIKACPLHYRPDGSIVTIDPRPAQGASP